MNITAITPNPKVIAEAIPAYDKIAKALGNFESIPVSKNIDEAMKITKNNALYFSPSTPVAPPTAAKIFDVKI